MMRLRSAPFVATAVTLLATPHSATAQTDEHAFETIDLRVHLAANVVRNAIHRYWNADPSLELGLEMPFYLGNVEAGLHYGRFKARGPEQPDFTSLFPFLGWGLAWRITPRLVGYAGGRIGDFLTLFDTQGSNQLEQELGLGLVSSLSYRVAGRWSVAVSFRHRTVFTEERIRLNFVAVGLSRSFHTPKWLRDFLD